MGFPRFGVERWQKGGEGIISRASLSNLGAQGAALASVSLASLFVARVGGPTVVGEYALLRVLPWLFGVVLSFGLPTASAFFLAGEDSADRSLRPTLLVMTVCGSVLGAIGWLACAAPFHRLFFERVPLHVIVLASFVVVTQLVTVTAKACCQGSHDIAGANLVIIAEELWFVFCYPIVVLAMHQRDIAGVVWALLGSGTLAALTGIARLARRGFFSQFARPSRTLAKRIAVFGARGQLGNLLWLTNLRFDFILLGALAGPAVLGIYSVASKFAELLRLAPTALNYVLYPRFAKLGREKATIDARTLLPRALALTVALTPFVALAALVGPSLLYGPAFHGAVRPAEIIIFGLSIEGAAAVSSAYLLGTGRPGLNSIGMGVGAVLTVGLDLILIPRYGAVGGAITSAVVYATTTITLTYIAHRVGRGDRDDSSYAPDVVVARARLADLAPGYGVDSLMRRCADLVISLIAVILLSPVLLVTALAVRATSSGPALYKQVRVGRSGRPFTLLKFRSMVNNAESLGTFVTSATDRRVTGVGALLRASKLDELPQLFNVLRGDMTLIGPRPEVPFFLRWYDDEEIGLLHVRPGLTGPGQIFYTEEQASDKDSGYDADAYYIRFQLHQKLWLDLEYLRHRGFWADLAVVMRTATLMFHRRHSIPTLVSLQHTLAASSNRSPQDTDPYGIPIKGLPKARLSIAEGRRDA